MFLLVRMCLKNLLNLNYLSAKTILLGYKRLNLTFAGFKRKKLIMPDTSPIVLCHELYDTLNSFRSKKHVNEIVLDRKTDSMLPSFSDPPSVLVLYKF